MEAAWIAVIGTLGGVLITALTGITTAMLTARFQARASVRQIQVETVRLLRAEKRDIFVQYLEAYQQWYDEIMRISNERFGNRVSDDAEAAPAPAESPREGRLRFSRAYSALSITGGPEVRRWASATTQSMWDLEKAAADAPDRQAYREVVQRTRKPRRELQDAMRAELDLIYPEHVVPSGATPSASGPA